MHENKHTPKEMLLDSIKNRHHFEVSFRKVVNVGVFDMQCTIGHEGFECFMQATIEGSTRKQFQFCQEYNRTGTEVFSDPRYVVGDTEEPRLLIMNFDNTTHVQFPFS